MELVKALESLAAGSEAITCPLLKEVYGPKAKLIVEDDSDWLTLVGAEYHKDQPVWRLSLFWIRNWTITAR